MPEFLSRRCSAAMRAPSAFAGALTNIYLFVPLVLALLGGGLVPRLVAQTPTPVPVPTWRYDNTHAGENTNETALQPDNVNASTFGKLFSVPVDGVIYAQPLYIPGLTMSDGVVHNVLFVATGHDSIYAFDADSNTGANVKPIWHITLLDAAHGAPAGATTIPDTDTGSPDVAPEIGITGTPAINPATNTMYVLAASKESGAYFIRLHAINILTGAEQANSPAAIQATVAGTGNGSSGGQLAFSPLWENQRVGLDYYSGHVYFAFAAHGDLGPWHGWVFAYDATTLAQTAAICLSPNGIGAGVWGAGAAMPIDDGGTAGRMFVPTGNGTYASYPPFSANSELSDGVVAFDLSNGGLTPIDDFTSFNQATLSSQDLDLGSGGVLILPDQPGANPHVLVQTGKEGRIVVLNRDSLGGYASGATSNTNALQDISGQTGGLWSTPAYWNGNVYMWGKTDVPKMFTVNSGLLSTTPSSQSTVASVKRGTSFTVSSNGAQDGVAWAVLADQYSTHGAEVLYAFDASNLSNLLYESDTNSARDGAGQATKFPIPVVTNGKVYVPALSQLNVYGLFDGEPIAAAPVISPKGGTFPKAQSVTLSTATQSANIFYTLDGTVPTPGSTLYTGSISISKNTTVRAIAVASGFIQSPESSASFTFGTVTPTPTFSPAAGTYSTAQSVAIADTDTNATIHYTTDGTTPTGSSPTYAGPIAVAASLTIKAIAIDSSLPNSTVATAAYVIQTAGSTINFGSGFPSSAGLSLVGSATVTGNLLQLTTAGASTNTGAAWFNTPLNIGAFTTDFNFQLLSAKGGGFTFVIQNSGASIIGPGGSGLGYGASQPGGTGGIEHSVAVKFDIYNNDGEGTDSTGYYTDGASPTVPATSMTGSGVTLNSGHTFHAHITYDGTNLTMVLTDTSTSASFTKTAAINIPSTVGAGTAYVGFTGGSSSGAGVTTDILNWTYTAQTSTPATAAPVFSPPAGNYTTPQSVSLSSATAGATIYYTTDGTTPTTSSSVYNSAIAVGTGTTTIEAFAVASGSSPSAVVSAQYVVASGQTPIPTFSPAAGTYTSAQSVSLSDTDSNATIYYTTNGSTPTAGSQPYTGQIAVAASITIKAIGIDPSLQNSNVATAAYVIQSGTPTINFGSGFSSAAGLSLVSSAKVASNLLQITTAGATSTTGAAWFTTPVNIGTFTTDFNFQLLSAKGGGFTFVIQNAGVSVIGPGGSGLGYGASQPGGTPGLAHSVAIKFDIYNNDGEGTDSTGYYTDGASPTIPATTMSGSGVTLNDGDVFHAHITYDGTNLTMVLTDTSTSKSFTKTAAINIPSIVGAGSAYAGFTGGSTGGAGVTTEILNWTMTSP